MQLRASANTANAGFMFCRRTQVIAFICGFIVIILMVLALASTDWLMAAGFREGLFLHCIEDDAVAPLPFNMEGPAGCYASRDVGEYFSAAYVEP